MRRKEAVIKVLVFDATLAAISVGSYIEEELPVEVEKIVDDSCHTKEEVAARISFYIGRVDVVVLAGSLLSAKCAEYLERRYPAQKFIFFGANLPEVIAKSEEVSILTPRELRHMDYYQLQKAQCQGWKIRELDCERWAGIIRERSLRWEEMIMCEVEGSIGMKLIINSPELVAVYDELERVLDWRVNLIDLRKEIVAELKRYFTMKEGSGRGQVIERTILVSQGVLGR